jgi:hypothetical protein
MIIYLAILVLAGIVVSWTLWSIYRAVCRKFGVSTRTQLLVVGGICVTVLGVLIFESIDRLKGIEKTCESELLKTERVSGAAAVVIGAHYDFWTRRISGGGWITPWVSEPYQTPKVMMMVNFFRDGVQHYASINCWFAKVPDSGNPPQVVFQRVEFISDDVLNERGQRVPWQPKPRN